MPSPMPVPPDSRRVVKNGSKILARLAAEIPSPSSPRGKIAGRVR